MSPRAPPTKNAVSIQLTEPVIFLRGSTDSVVRGRNPENGVPQPAILRGLLTLTLVKPTKIKSIDVDLEGWAKNAWPEGIGARSIEMSEEHKILSASTVFFRAGHHPHTHISTSNQQQSQDPPSVSSSVRRAASVGPGLALDWDDDQEIEAQYSQNLDPTSTSNANTNGIVNNNAENDYMSSPPNYTRRRRASADYSTYNTTAVEHNQPNYVYVDDPPSFDDAISSPIIGPVGGALSPIHTLSPIASPSSFTPHTPPHGHGQGHGHAHIPTHGHTHGHTHLQAPQFGRSNSSSSASGSGSSLRAVPEGIRQENLTETLSGVGHLSANDTPYTHANLSSAAASTHSSESDSSLVLSPLPEAVLSRLPSHENDMSPIPVTSSESHSHSSLALSPRIQSQSLSPMSSSTHVNRNSTIGLSSSNTSSNNNIHSGRSRSRGRRMSAVPLTSNTRIPGTGTVTPRSVPVSTNTQSMGSMTPDTSVLSHSNRNSVRETSRGALLNSPTHSLTYSPSSTSHHNSDTQHSTRRHSSRFSLSAVSNALMEGLDAVKHRVRSRSRADGHTIGERQSRDPERRRSAILNGEGSERSARRQSGNFTNGTHHHAHHSLGFNFGHGTAGFGVGVGAVPSRDASLERGHEGVHHNVHHRDMETIGESSASASASMPNNGKHKEHSAFGWLGEAFGHDHNQENEHVHKESTHGDGWKEFRKGTYTYPISFLIPNNSPPTLHCALGSVSYTLRATAHRPGAFSTRLTTRREVTFVAAPGEDDIDESDSILVQRQWEDQMHYVIAVHGKAYPVGGKIPISLTFMPLAKIRLYRLSAYVEEHVEYFSNFKRLVRAEAPKKFDLLSLKYTIISKDIPPRPILPLDESYASSPLYGHVLASDEDEAASSLMGPGPWTLHTDLKLPHSSTCKYHDRANRNGQEENSDPFGREYSGGLHFTNKHKRSNIAVTHFLKVVLRVERGDDQVVDPKTGKRRMFDIVIQMPIHILSCQCNAQSTSLPLYSVFAPSFSQWASTRNLNQQSRDNEGNGDLYVNDEQPPAFHSNDTSSSNLPSDSLNSTSDERTHTASPTVQADLHPQSANASRSASRAGSRASAFTSMTFSAPNIRPSPGSSIVRGTSETAERRPSPSGSVTESTFSRNFQFARLVAGHESESGEAPPDYEAHPPGATDGLVGSVRDRPQLSLNLSDLQVEEERGRSRIRRVGGGVGDVA